MRKKKKQKRQTYKQSPARRKAHKNTPPRNVTAMPFMIGPLMGLSDLTLEEAEHMSAEDSNNPSTMSWVSAEEYVPTMVLWKADFTDDDPFFFLSFDPRETKANMVYNIMGVVPRGLNESPNAIGEMTTTNGTVFCIGTWEAFLVDANEKQVKQVRGSLGEFNLPLR